MATDDVSTTDGVNTTDDVSTTDVVDLTEPAAAPAPSGGRWARLASWGRGVRPAWKALAAYLMYQALAFWIWVLPILPRFARQHLGSGSQDSRMYQWDISWTPWALLHHMDPLHAGWIFAPTGTTLSWSAFVPGPGLVAWPITRIFGPLVALNVILAVSPALAAWAAYLVCHRLTRAFWPSVVGGCLFGFSSYLAANMVGYVNLVVIFPIPLLVYVVIRRVEGSLGPVTFVAGFAAALVFLFSVSTELFGTTAVVGGIAFVGAVAFGGEIRRALLRTGALIVLAGAVAAVVLAPYIHDVLVFAPTQPVRPAAVVAQADLWSVVVPPPVIRAGGNAFAERLQGYTKFPRPNGQGYLGFAVIAMLIGFAITGWRRASTWLLIGLVGLVTLLTLGPVLHVGGVAHGSLPEALLADTRLLRSVIPARFAVFAFLGVGVIAAMWLAGSSGRFGWVRWVVALAAVVSLIPSAPGHRPPQEVPAFFTTGADRDVLRQDENVYAIPYETGEEMLWQETADYWFKMAQGYIGWVPTAVDSGPLAHGLHVRGKPYRPTPEEFAAWLHDHRVSAVVMDDRAAGRFGDLLASAGLTQTYSGGGVSVWRPPA
jgi:hypothetical protein